MVLSNNGKKSYEDQVPHGHKAKQRADRERIWRRVVAADAEFDPAVYLDRGLHPRTVEALGSALPSLKARLNGCGQIPVGSVVSLGITPSGAFQEGGVKTCGSPSCPCCTATREGQNAARLDSALQLLQVEGAFRRRRLLHVVIGVGKALELDQVELIQAFTRAFAALRLRSVWKVLDGCWWSIEVAGSLRAGSSGLGPHAHVLALFDDELEMPGQWGERLEEVARSVFAAEGLEVRWPPIDHTLTKGWLTECLDTRSAAGYVARPGTWGAAIEATCGGAKRIHGTEEAGLVGRDIEALALIDHALANKKRNGSSGLIRTALRRVGKPRPVKAVALLHISRSAWTAPGRREREDMAARVESMARSGAPVDALIHLLRCGFPDQAPVCDGSQWPVGDG